MKDKILLTGGSGFIGTHLIDELETRGFELLNLDVNPPPIKEHIKYWKKCDIKNNQSLKNEFDQYMPTLVIHLAANTNIKGKKQKDFPDNTIGTDNVVKQVNDCISVQYFIHTSTQYVVRPGIYPKDDMFLKPYTAYGESKAITELIVRNHCKKKWAIIRPTNIWGPYHPFFSYELWRYLHLRYYIHPGYQPIIKYYGYVSNAVEQILQVALSDSKDVSGGVYYITDSAIDNADWMNGFSLLLTGKMIRRVPVFLWWIMAMSGNFFNFFNLKFPVNTDRFFRLTVNEFIPEFMIVNIPADKTVSLDEGIRRSVEWYNSIYN